MPTSLFLIAGEASGDLHTANMVRELKKQDSAIKLFGLGGPQMKKEGVEIFFDMTTISTLGFLEVLPKYFEFRKIFYDALEKVKEIKPDAVVLTDFPGFNLRFAKQVKKLGIPVIFYVSPQVWAWKKNRIHTIPKIVDKMLVILPFEKDLYKDPQMEVTFVGHPLVKHVKPSKPKHDLLEELNLSATHSFISLVPGSRHDEMKRIFPLMIQTAEILKKDFPFVQFLITKSPTLPASLYEEPLKKVSFNYRLIEGRMYDCLSVSDFAIIKSGTSTLEATLLGTPYILVYKTSFFTYLFARLVIQIPFLGMANIIAGKRIIEEFLQYDAKPIKMAQFIRQIFSDKEKLNHIREDLRKVKEELETPNPSGEAAKAVLEFLEH